MNKIISRKSNGVFSSSAFLGHQQTDSANACVGGSLTSLFHYEINGSKRVAYDMIAL